MKTSYLNLNKILDLKKWQNLQDSLSVVTKLAIITVDYKGAPITQHSNIRPFCRRVRKDSSLVNLCEKCDSRGGLEAVRINAPHIFLCHWNIIDIAVPIIIDNKYIGAVMAGEVRLPDREEEHLLEQMLHVTKKELVQVQHNEELMQLYRSIPTLPFSEIKNIAQMLYDLCHYIVEEALNKNLMLEAYEKLQPLKGNFKTDVISNGYSLDHIRQLKKELASSVTNAYVSTSLGQFFCKNQTLQPAFDYIFKHKGEKILQSKMAELCHISTGYFSRLFVKETEMNFSTFMSMQKIEWSKQLLEKTDLSIGQISDELGFNDPGYYIKTFKKYENLTPFLYRKYFKENL